MMWNFKAFEKNTAAVDDLGNEIKYRELDELCHSFKNAVGKRCLIFCMCSNTIGSFIGYVASIQMNIVPLMLDYSMDSSLFQKLVETYKPQFVWQPEESKISDRLRRDEFSLYGYRLFATEFVDSQAVLFEELALLLTTSGSTGSPKLVRQSYTNIRSNTESIVQYLDLSSDERAITTLPMNYTYGLSIINTHLYVGAMLLLTEKAILQKDFWDFFRANEATSFGGVPYTYEMLKKLKFADMEIPSLRTMTQAGGKLGAELHKEFAVLAEEKKISFVVMYGASEATARMTYLPASMSLKKSGSIGIAIPGGRMEIIDLNGESICEYGTVGEFVYYGENVTLGYAASIEDLAKTDERGGRYETGDIGYCDSDGYFYVTGRKKRFLKVYGNRVSLDEVEKILKQRFKTGDIVCNGKDDFVAVFVTEDEKDPDEIRTYISKITKINLSAFKVYVIKEIPRNASGKVMYGELEKYYD